MKVLILNIVWLCLILNPLIGQQPGRLTDKFFPEVDKDFNTPAFNGKWGFTNYKELIAFLENRTSEVPFATLEYIGETQRGRSIPLVILSKPTERKKVRVWLQGGIHGNEPASSEGMLSVLHELLDTDKYNYLLDRLEIAIAPMVNIDGYMRQNRLAKGRMDLNRDLVKLQVKETIQLKKRYSDFSPHVSVDFHEYNPFRAAFRTFGAMGYTSYYDAMFLYSGDLNIEREIRTLTEDLFVANAQKQLDDLGYTHHDYFSPQSDYGKLYFNLGSTAARSSATSFALGNSISILMEIRGIKLNRNSFERRVAITQTTAFSFLHTAFDQYEVVLEGVGKAIASTISRKRVVVADSRRKVENKAIKFIDIEKNEMVESEFEIASAKEMEPLIIRKRPQAYLLAKDQIVAVKNLQILGLTIDTLQSEQRLPVESYTVTEQVIQGAEYQGYYPNEVSTQINSVDKVFEKGTFIIRLDQKNANLAVTALEPENDNGFVRFCVIDASKGKEIPIYRLMSDALNIKEL